MSSRFRFFSIYILATILLFSCKLPAALRAFLISPTPSSTRTSAPTSSPSLTPSPTATRTPTPLPLTETPQATPSFQMDGLIPRPVSATPAEGMFYLTPGMKILVQPDSPQVREVAQDLADMLNPPTGYHIIVGAEDTQPLEGNITLSLNGADSALGPEGYRLEIKPDRVTVEANQPAGLFYAVQTIRQLLPATIESSSLQPGPWVIQAGTITDYPRFAYRGVMLDVARHFFTVQDVERYIDLLALYKINFLHLHLTDDQGWRIEIKSWPDLTAIGGQTQVGGGKGGFYTQAEYSEIVTYAQSHFITIVPEIDMPGHVTAALASYPVLTCDGVAPQIYITIHVNYSSLCLSKDTSYQFMQDVLQEVAGLTPGPYIHIGGDEAGATAINDYVDFMQRAQSAVEAQGKHIIGWEEIAQINLSPGSIVQHWNYGEGNILQAHDKGNRLIMSPVDRTYMNIKYDSTTQLGPDVGIFINIETAYDWDPSTIVAGIKDADILGLEAPLWTEMLQSLPGLEYMTFPRLPGYAEIGWTPQALRDWQGYRLRLAEQGPRLGELDVNFFRSPEIPWK